MTSPDGINWTLRTSAADNSWRSVCWAAELGLLVAVQSLGGASPPIIISLGGLVGQMLSSTPSAATLPVSLYQLGLALSTLPAAWLIHRAGRRTGVASAVAARMLDTR